MENVNLEDYLPFVKSIIAPYINAGLPYEDLLQEGMLGLWEAAQRFDPSRNTKLTTYAAYWIKKRIITAIRKEKKDSMGSTELNESITASTDKEPQQQGSETIILPDNMPENEKKVLTLSFEKQLTLNEIANELQISREKARQLKQKGMRRLKAVIGNKDID